MNSVLNPVSEKRFQEINEEELRQNRHYLDDNTMMTQFSLTDDMRRDICSDREFWKDDQEEAGQICETVTCEYQLDTDQMVYSLVFAHDTVDMTAIFSCDGLNHKIRKLHQD